MGVLLSVALIIMGTVSTVRKILSTLMKLPCVF